MDHNLDLLKTSTHPDTQKFLDINFEGDIYPCITRPMRITKTSATLIDNIFIKKELHKSFDACVVMHDLSDHMPCIVNIHDLKQSNNEPLEFERHTLTDKKMLRNKSLTTDY